jgi:hypothetical protein
MNFAENFKNHPGVLLFFATPGKITDGFSGYGMAL